MRFWYIQLKRRKTICNAEILNLFCLGPSQCWNRWMAPGSATCLPDRPRMVQLSSLHNSSFRTPNVPWSYSTQHSYSWTKGTVHRKRFYNKPDLHNTCGATQPQSLICILELQWENHYIWQRERRHSRDIRPRRANNI